jgi:hypothetical protein
MKKLLWVVALCLAATPAFAQEEGGGGPAFGGGGGGDQVFTRVDAVNPMDQVKTFLQTKANITLSSDQEKTLRPVVETALQKIRDLSAGQRGAQGGQAAPAGRGRGNRGGRGGDNGEGSISNLASGPAAQELRKINDDLMAKITEALKPDQQAAFKKYLDGEIKRAGGFPALKLTMQEAGAPLTAEQEPQIQAFYNEDAQQRQQLQREAQGRPDPAKVADLEKATMAKIVKVLTPAQRKALLDSRTKDTQKD